VKQGLIGDIIDRYRDFGTRTATALVLAVICLAGIWRGGLPFLVLCGILVALLIYELLLLTAANMPHWHRLMITASSGIAFCLVVEALLFQYLYSIAACVFLPMATSLFLRQSRELFAIYGATIFLAANQLFLLRTYSGFDFLLAVLLAVVASDMAGYFIGRLVKGPRLPARFSPNKTWSGTTAGWLAAMAVWCISTGSYTVTNMVLGLMLALSAQAGDLGQSWLKRKADVKDSSSLLPGHGGIYDRFDSVIGAGMLMMIIGLASYLTG